MTLLWIKASVFADEHSDVPQNNFLQSVSDTEITLENLCQLFKNTYRELYQETEHRSLEIMKLQTFLKYDLPPWYMVKELSDALAQWPFIRIIRSHTVESASEPGTTPKQTLTVYSAPKNVVKSTPKLAPAPAPAPALTPEPTSKRRKISRRQTLPVGIPVSEKEATVTAEPLPALPTKKRTSSGKRKGSQPAKAPANLPTEYTVREQSEEAVGTIIVRQEAPILQNGDLSKPSRPAEVLAPSSPVTAALPPHPTPAVSQEPVPIGLHSPAEPEPLETNLANAESQVEPDLELPLCTVPDVPDDECSEPELSQPRLPEPELPEPELPEPELPEPELPEPELPEPELPEPELPALSPSRPKSPQPELSEKESLPQPPLLPSNPTQRPESPEQELSVLSPPEVELPQPEPLDEEPSPLAQSSLPDSTPGPESLEPKMPEPKMPEPKMPEPKMPEPKMPEPKMPEPKMPEPKMPEPELPELPEPDLPEPELPEPELPEPELPEPELPSVSPPKTALPQPEPLEEELLPQLPPLLPDPTAEPEIVPSKIHNSPKNRRSSVASPASKRKTDLEKPLPIATTEVEKDTIISHTRVAVKAPHIQQRPPFRGFTPINKLLPPPQYPLSISPRSPENKSECQSNPESQSTPPSPVNVIPESRSTPPSPVNAIPDLEYASLSQFEGRATPDLSGTEIIERGIALLRQEPRDEEPLVDISEFFHLDRMPELEFLQDNVYPEERPADTPRRGGRNHGVRQVSAPAIPQPVDNSQFPQSLSSGYPSLPLTGGSSMGPPAPDWVPASHQPPALPALPIHGDSFSNSAISQIPSPGAQIETQPTRMAQLTNSQSTTPNPAPSRMPLSSPTDVSQGATKTGAMSTRSFDNSYSSDSDSGEDIIPGSHGRTSESASRSDTPSLAKVKFIARPNQSRDIDMQATVAVAMKARWATAVGTTPTRASGIVSNTRETVGTGGKAIKRAVEIAEAEKTPVMSKTVFSETSKTTGLNEPSPSLQQASTPQSATRAPVANMRSSYFFTGSPNADFDGSKVEEVKKSEGKQAAVPVETSTNTSLRANRLQSTILKPAASSQEKKTPTRAAKTPTKSKTASKSPAAKKPVRTRITRSRNAAVTEPMINGFEGLNDNNKVDVVMK